MNFLYFLSLNSEWVWTNKAFASNSEKCKNFNGWMKFENDATGVHMHFLFLFCIDFHQTHWKTTVAIKLINFAYRKIPFMECHAWNLLHEMLWATFLTLVACFQAWLARHNEMNCGDVKSFILSHYWHEKHLSLAAQEHDLCCNVLSMQCMANLWWVQMQHEDKIGPFALCHKL